ncbi:hypothetical protein [Rhizobium laguerreae]|uniref:hypothetical protein n=1 Tax=Rhizobium laguerreae TaxID=1076926 RepID=UPI001C90D92F|nr:hypothetical protein [Rhizobium laguerreae]MBY3133842.1 hypothetical protein [Rhizobium laguerreae]
MRDGAELGAEFSAYRLDLALGALQQDLDRSAVSPPPGRYQDGSLPRGKKQPLTVQVLCPLRTYFKELCTLDISIPTYPIGYDAGCAALFLRFGRRMRDC